MTSWTAHDLARALKISPAAAKQALAILEMQGYVKPTGSKEWTTTPAGEIVSGSKFPRCSRETVERSLESFADHLKRVNEDTSAEYKIAEAVAFGDFLSGRARVQAADVGIRLEPRDPGAYDAKSASEQGRQEAFLKHFAAARRSSISILTPPGCPPEPTAISATKPPAYVTLTHGVAGS